MKYDQEYYFVRRQKNKDSLPSLSPDADTEDRQFRFAAQSIDSPPLFFLTEQKTTKRSTQFRVKKIFLTFYSMAHT